MTDRPPTADLLRLHEGDDVATALRPLEAGERLALEGEPLLVTTAVPKGHKVALRDIPAGELVSKYGFPIGAATTPIGRGEHVHVHNLKTRLTGEADYAWTPSAAEPVAAEAGTFKGYLRADGRVGTRNEIWIIPTVGCVARTAEKLARAAGARFAGRVDGVHAFAHPFGCSQLGDDLDKTRALLAALAQHPNAGGVLLVGLGCENNQLKALLEAAPGLDPTRVRSFAAQAVEDETEAGLEAIEALVEIAARDVRSARPLADLVVGLKCGGSDGFSGLTANPLVGRIADRVAAAGGRPVLTEIPEIFGAEQVLMARATSHEVFDGVAAVVNDFKRYFLDHGQPVSENPSPGNIEGGITTLEEKSLGAVQKGGRAPLTQVLRYGERVGAQPGLVLLEAPGNDAVSATALVAAGCTVVLFTTGRGTPLGFPAPTLKIATNSALAERKPGWIDFDAGCVLAGRTLDQAADDLMARLLAVASGEPARNEINEEREIAIWKTGVTL